jgi:uridylate kinase
MDNKMPIIVFDMMERENIRAAVLGKEVGTIVTGD